MVSGGDHSKTSSRRRGVPEEDRRAQPVLLNAKDNLRTGPEIEARAHDVKLTSGTVKKA